MSFIYPYSGWLPFSILKFTKKGFFRKVLDVIKFCSKFLPNFGGFDNVDLENNYAIEHVKFGVLEAV